MFDFRRLPRNERHVRLLKQSHPLKNTLESIKTEIKIENGINTNKPPTFYVYILANFECWEFINYSQH